MACTLTFVPARAISPREIVFGGIWLGPGAHDGNRPDLGQANADAAVAAALAGGICEFDTAPWYGGGASEERLGRAIGALGADAMCNVRVTTKAGRLFREPGGTQPCLSGFDEPGRAPPSERVCVNDFTAAGARISLLESLDRMRLPQVFGLRIHDPNDNSLNNPRMDTFVDEVEIAVGPKGLCAAMRKLRDERVIQHVGIGMNCNKEPHMGAPEEILRLLRGCECGTFDSALLAGGWNLLSQDGLSCFEECERRGVAVHVAGVFASGLLVSSSGTYAYQPAPPGMIEKTERWRNLAAKHSFSLPAVAIAFAALPKCVTRLVIGMATPEQVRETLEWVAESVSVPAALWNEAKTLGLLGIDIGASQV